MSAKAWRLDRNLRGRSSRAVDRRTTDCAFDFTEAITARLHVTADDWVSRSVQYVRRHLPTMTLDIAQRARRDSNPQPSDP
jgi:hypothetical protein